MRYFTPATLPTPTFVLDLVALERNMQSLHAVKARTGCRVLLALKAFSMPSAFPYMREALDGCCASSVHEARLAREEFGGEVHAFAAAFSRTEMKAITELADHVTLNSLQQLHLFNELCDRLSPEKRPTCGLRINPEHSEGAVAIYDPCAPGSRLGVRRSALSATLPTGVTGLHSHTLCEQNAAPFVRTLAAIEARFGDLLAQIKWINFGGGHHITRADYDLDLLCDTLNAFRQRHPHIERVYLEPGEACVLNAGTLVAQVLDVVQADMPVAILDASCCCHLPDVLEMPYRPNLFRDPLWTGSATPTPTAERGALPHKKHHTVRLAGASCLAGDIFGEWCFETPLRPGDRLIFEDMAHYTMVKTNTFNGIALPNIAIRESGGIRLVKSFGYDDFLARL